VARGAKTRSLKSLTREPPEELRPLFELITHPEHPDASVAMLGCAILDHVLADAIVRELQGNVVREDLFGDRGPLRDFYGKIVLAEAMGVILPAMARDLHRLRQVRNAFAHAVTPIGFDLPEVLAEIEGLSFFGQAEALRSGLAGEDASPKQFFGAYIFITCVSLIMTPTQWAELRDEVTDWVSDMVAALEAFRGVRVDPPDAK
jgi:hypothetical protein